MSTTDANRAVACIRFVQPWVVDRTSIGRESLNLLVELRHQTGLVLKYWPEARLIQLWKPYPTCPWQEVLVRKMNGGEPFPLRKGGHFNLVPSLEAVMECIHESWLNDERSRAEIQP